MFRFVRSKLEKLLMLYLFLILGIIILVSLLLWREYANVIYQRGIAEKNLQYWEQIVMTHPNYPDGYYKLAVAQLNMKHSQDAAHSLDMAIRLDPGFREAIELRSSIEK